MTRSYLTDSEHHIMQSLAYGKTLDEIAATRGVAYTTVRNMMTMVVDKIESTTGTRPDKTGAVIWLIQQSIIALPETYNPNDFNIG